MMDEEGGPVAEDMAGQDWAFSGRKQPSHARCQQTSAASHLGSDMIA